MGASSEPRDHYLAQVLARLEPPMPSHGFWRDLEEALRAADAPATPMSDAADAPYPPITDLHSVRTVQPRRRRLASGSRFLAVAAFIAAVVAVAAFVAGAGGRDGKNVLAGAPEAPGTSAITPGTNSPEPSPGPQSADEAVVTWIEALGRGDTAAAAALLAPASARYAAEMAGSAAAFMTEVSEGYGAWAASPDRSTVEMTVTSGGDGGIEVVVLLGTVIQEGSTQYRTDAIPVRFDGNEYRVEPFDFSENEVRIEFVRPAIGPSGAEPVGPNDKIELIAPNAESVTLSLDDSQPVTERPAGDGRIRYAVPEDIAAQSHLLIVASVGPDHLIASAIRFRTT